MYQPPFMMQQQYQVGAVIGGRRPVSVNPDYLIMYLMASSRLLINCLSSPDRVPTTAAMGLCKMAEEDARPEAEDNKPAGPGTETEDKRVDKTLDGCTYNRQ